MTWPLSQDYNESIQSPATSFSDAELRGGQPVTNALGIPQPRSGNFADVYEFDCPQTKSKWAIKCFTREVRGLHERYAEISRHLHEAKLPFGVDFHYLEQGMRIRGVWYPVLKMRWIEGLLLNDFVRDILDKPARLQGLYQIWLRMAKRLREAEMAHADLQHGNVILVPGSTANALAIKLIDYDGMFVPALSGRDSGEVGHPNYQHPQRLKDGTWSVEVDRFPLLVVATALRALSVSGRPLWDRYDNGDNLLFKESDLRAPEQSPLFKDLLKIGDSELRSLVEQVKRAASRPLQECPLLEEPAPLKAVASVTKKATSVTASGHSSAGTEGSAFDFSGKIAGRPIRREEGTSRVPLLAGAIGGGVLLLGLVIGAIVWATRPTPTKPQPDTSLAQSRPETGKKHRDKTDPTKTKEGKPKTTPLPVTDPDRKAAEYVLSIGGMVRVNGEKQDIKATADLPPEGFQLTFASLYGNTQVNDSGLASFAGCKNLAHLDLYRTNVSDSGLANFKECKELEYLQLSGTKVSDVGLAHFKDCRNLKLLDLQEIKLTDVGLAWFAGCKNLTYLDLWSTQVSDSGLAHLANWENLAILSLRGTKVGNAGLAHVKNCKNLRWLLVSNTQVSDLSAIEGMKLTRLDCEGTKVTDLSPLKGMSLKELSCDFKAERDTEILRSITTLEKINEKPAKDFWKGAAVVKTTDPDRKAAEYVLSIGGMVRANGEERESKAAADLPREAFRWVNLNGNKQVSDSGLASFKDCKNLTVLSLIGTKVGDAGLAHLKGCKTLAHLDLGGTKVSDAGLAHLKDCKSLTYLGLKKTKVTKAKIKELQKALPRCKIESDGR